MNATYQIELTHLESLHISDSLSMFQQGPPDALSKDASPYPNLLLKVGSAVLETEKAESPIGVNLTLSELWILRESAKSTAVVGNERVGINLLMKIYKGIQALTAQEEVALMVNVYGEVSRDELDNGDYVTYLGSTEEGGGLSSGGDSNEDTEHKPDNTNEN